MGAVVVEERLRQEQARDVHKQGRSSLRAARKRGGPDIHPIYRHMPVTSKDDLC
jgi:hypothetical protein